jgi:hypothetical protein
MRIEPGKTENETNKKENTETVKVAEQINILFNTLIKRRKE